MPLPKHLEILLLVHGVDSRAEWYSTAKGVFEPHFSCREIRYHDFEKWGKVKVIVEPAAALRGAFVAVAAATGMILFHVSGFFIVGLSGFIVGWFGLRGSDRLRGRTAIAVAEAFDAADGEWNAPNILAHSFGTYLTGELLVRFRVNLKRVALVGSVLKRRFDWKGLRNASSTLIDVRNEVAPRDVVVRAAKLLPFLGSSGTAGFFGDPSVVHSIGATPCPLCHVDSRALVHNLKRGQFEHSDCFVRSGYLREQFLPFFFGIEPTEFYDFICLCRRGSAALNARDSVQVAAVDELFANRYWQWAAGQTLDGYIAKQLSGVSQLTAIRSSAVALIARTVWRIVDAACEARGDRTKDHRVLAMRPHIAVARATRAATP